MFKPSLATSLPLKVSMLIAALFVCYAGAQFLVQQKILYPSFVALEQSEALKNSKRALKAIDRELELLAPQVADWSAWDDTYAFLQDRNRTYFEENLTVETMQHLKIGYLGFVALNGEVIWQLALDPASSKPLAPAVMGFDKFHRNDALFRASIAFDPGVRGLRKIGNAVTPLGIKLSTIIAELRRAPVQEVRLARSELADQATTADRREDLETFLMLAAADLATLAEHTDHGVTRAVAHVEHVELVLADQECFARAERVVESLTIAATVRECLSLMSPAALRVTATELSPTLELAPPVRVSRSALRQVITNLLVNASESISAHRGRGLLRIETKVDVHHGTIVLRTEFIDDGIGIATNNLGRIFEAGVSDKKRGSGIGLHWSANAIAAMGGALWAESAGHGTGACIVMLLPLAKTPMMSEQAA